MAQVVQDPELRDRIEHYLDYLLREWRSIPEIAAEWDEWEELERLDFVLEWPIREDRMHQLRNWSAQGLLTPSQCARYDEVLKLEVHHRPALEQLLKD